MMKAAIAADYRNGGAAIAEDYRNRGAEMESWR